VLVRLTTPVQGSSLAAPNIWDLLLQINWTSPEVYGGPRSAVFH